MDYDIILEVSFIIIQQKIFLVFIDCQPYYWCTPEISKLLMKICKLTIPETYKCRAIMLLL